jgi:hypothetical protein
MLPKSYMKFIKLPLGNLFFRVKQWVGAYAKKYNHFFYESLNL